MTTSSDLSSHRVVPGGDVLTEDDATERQQWAGRRAVFGGRRRAGGQLEQPSEVEGSDEDGMAGRMVALCGGRVAGDWEVL